MIDMHFHHLLDFFACFPEAIEKSDWKLHVRAFDAKNMSTYSVHICSVNAVNVSFYKLSHSHKKMSSPTNSNRQTPLRFSIIIIHFLTLDFH